jgi:hypothetical protein
MKKILLSSAVFLMSTCAHAQTIGFSVASPQPNIMEAYGGVFATGDIDGDGDKDLFMTGITPQIYTKLYKNDGSGNFTEINHNFPRSGSSQAILKDLDGDGDLDLFFSGSNELSQKFANIYKNDGTGVFTQVTNNNLPKFIKGANIADVDNDGDQDLVISATTTTGFVADVYLNNGSAFFTAKGSTVFTAVNGVLAFIDIENDGDKDVIISGKDVNNASSTKLYQNDGSGTYILNTSSTFASVAGEDIDVIDTDNDGDLDILLNGSFQNKLYTNNGSGVFTLASTSLQQTFAGQNVFADFDKDGDQDLIIVGSQNGGLPNIYNILYKNTGNNIFTPVDTLGGEYIADCVAEDFNGDGLKDIIIQGFANKTNVYWNSSTPLSISTPKTINHLIKAFPNPTTEFIQIQSDKKIESYKVLSIAGKIVAQRENLNLSEFSINMNLFVAGTYIIVLQENNEHTFLNVLKK